MKNKIFLVWGILIAMGCHTNLHSNDLTQDQASDVVVAREMLIRILGDCANSIKLEKLLTKEGYDSYEYCCSDGILTVKGSSVNSLTRGTYDYLRSKHMGMLDWSGSMFRLPNQWPDTPTTFITTPCQVRHAYNAVTSGYTSPYWDWERWEQELDWQVMHGFNMMMAPVATEAIMLKVWRKLGLAQEEIDKDPDNITQNSGY